MFVNSRIRLALHEAIDDLQERRDAPRCDVLLGVRGGHGEMERRYGVLSLGGCDFDANEPMRLGRHVHLRVYLLGLGKGFDVQGRVARLAAPRTPGLAARVVVRFTSLSFENERLIARWLDLVSGAYGAGADRAAA